MPKKQNKNLKLVIIIVIFSLLPLEAIRARFLIPEAFLTVVVNSGSESQSFNLNIRDRQVVPDFYEDFVLETVEGTASQAFNLTLFNKRYRVTEVVPEGWKLNSVICVTDNPNTISEPTENGILLTLELLSNTTCVFYNEKLQDQTPVLFIPGILGTEMFKDQEKLWADIPRMLKTNNDHFMDYLAFNPDATPSDNTLSIGGVLENPDKKFDYTEALKQEFFSQGYEVDKNLFLFPYDWREDITKTANINLKQKIDEIASSTKASKIDIIAHSQGGLVIKKLLFDLPEYQNKIGKLIFLGTPHLGSPKSAKVLLYGDSMGVSFLRLGLDPNELKLIGVNMPAVYQLLPSKEYFKHSSGYFGTLETPWFKDPKITLYDYETTKDKLKAEGLNSTLLDKAESFHTMEYDNFDFSNTSIDTYNIMGCVSPTLNSMLVKKRDFDKLVYGPGDGTVPIFSASNTIATKNIYFTNLDDIHGKMPSIDGVRQKIVNIITGSNLSTPSITDDVSECQFDGKQVSIHSPVDMHIYDSQGNHTGPLPDGNFENSIPGVAYDIIGEEKFAFLPAGQTFTIKLIATGSGIFSFNASIIENGQTTSTAHYNSIPISVTSTAEVITNSENNQTINFTSDSRIVHPSSILNSSESKDLIPPISTSTITGLMGDTGFYRSNATITLTSLDPVIPTQEDQTSGILNTKYNLDNGGYQTCSPLPVWLSLRAGSELPLAPSLEKRGKKQGEGSGCSIAVLNEGTHTLSFYTTDKAGNNEASQTLTFTIDKTAPEVGIKFSPKLKDLSFTGKDNITTTTKLTLLDLDDTLTVKDQAGNITEVKFKEQGRKQQLRAEIKSLSYNGVEADLNKHAFSFHWLFNKQGSLSSLIQSVNARQDFNVLALYALNKTVLTGQDLTGKFKKTLKGLTLLQVWTEKGELKWGY